MASFFDFTSNFFNRKKTYEEETEEMKEKKKELINNIELTKKLERELINQKFIEKKSKLDYQHSCPHKNLISIKNNNQQTNSTSFNDYSFKCEFCEAQIWNKSRSITYLSTLLDLLNKFPKVEELLKILKIEFPSDYEKFNQIIDLTQSLSELKERLISISDKEVNEMLTKLEKNS